MKLQFRQNCILKDLTHAIVEIVERSVSPPGLIPGRDTYRLSMCQDEDENKAEDEFFRSFRIKIVTNKPGRQYYDILSSTK